MGGTIKLVTNQPDPSGIAVSAQAIASDTKDGGLNYTVNGMLNLPLADKLALRIVGTDSYTDGWIDRVVLNPFPLETNSGFTRGNVLAAPVEHDYKDANWAQVQGVRAALQWQPIDALTITPTVFVQTITQGARTSSTIRRESNTKRTTSRSIRKNPTPTALSSSRCRSNTISAQSN